MDRRNFTCFHPLLQYLNSVLLVHLGYLTMLPHLPYDIRSLLSQFIDIIVPAAQIVRPDVR
jgi:hypothetical protein